MNHHLASHGAPQGALPVILAGAVPGACGGLVKKRGTRSRTRVPEVV